MDEPRVQLTFLRDYHPKASVNESIDDLSSKLKALPDFNGVDLVPNGRSTILGFVPAGGQHLNDRLKALVAEKVDGWQLIDTQTYGLPKTF